MSRAKKRTRTQKRRDEHAQAEQLVAERVANLSCLRGAADDLAVACGTLHEHAGYDLDLVVAAEPLWRRALPDGHAFILALADLRAELERHRAVAKALEQRFDVLMDDTTHAHATPEAEDIQRIRAAVLGDDAALDRASRLSHRAS